MRKRSDLLSGVHSINAIVIKHKKMQTRKEENKMQEPSNPEGLCIHRKKVLTSGSGLMTWQQRIHLHSRQNPGFEQHISQSKPSTVPESMLVPLSKLQFGFFAWHCFRDLFYALCQLTSSRSGLSLVRSAASAAVQQQIITTVSRVFQQNFMK
jgi:hypothetical protein